MDVNVTATPRTHQNVTAEAFSTGAIGRNGLVADQPVIWNRGGDYFYQYKDPTNADSVVEFHDEALRKKLRDAEEAKAKQPPPTAPDPAPPELIPDEGDALAVCLSPDVCKSPHRAVPYMSWGKADDKQNYSPNVRSNGKVIKRQDSKFSCCYGDEPGTGKGVKSGTVGDVVEPVTSSTIVRANGIPVQRHTDRCTLNNGNCPGEYVHVKSTAVHPAPDGNDAQDKTRDQKIADYAQSKGWTRAADGGWNTNPGGVGWASNEKVGEEMDYVNSGRGNVQPLTLGSGPSEIKAYEPSWTERIESSVQSGLMSLGMDKYQALQWGEKVGTLAGFVPGVGSGLSGNDSYRAYASGHPVLGTIHAVGALPLPGAGKLAEKLGVKAAERAAEKAAIRETEEKVAEKAVAEQGEVAKTATKTAENGARSTRLKKWISKDVNGRRVYQRDDLIDPDRVDDLGRTNKQRMEKGLAPIGDDGKEINLHHMTQDEPGPMAEVKSSFHSDNDRVLHVYSNQYDKMYKDAGGNWHRYSSAPPSMDRRPFNTWKSDYWKTRAKDF